MSINPLIEHGTITSYTNHKCRCELCRSAWASYVREYRQSNKARIRAQVRARSRAHTRLAAMYQIVFEEILHEELAKEGLVPPFVPELDTQENRNEH